MVLWYRPVYAYVCLSFLIISEPLKISIKVIIFIMLEAAPVLFISCNQ
jgi:hypothetical protein